MKTPISYISIITMLLLMRCSETVEPKPYSYSQIFTGKTSKTWRVDRLIFRQQGETDQNLSLSSCEKDDLYKFYANDEKLFEVDNGALACNGDDDEDLLVSYTWEFNQARATLTMVTPHIFGYFVIPFIVKEAREREFELEIFLDEEATISYVMIFKLVDEE